MMNVINQDLQITWCDANEQVRQAVRFFMENVNPDYISHGEIQSGRAHSFSQWSVNLADVLQQEFAMCLKPVGEVEAYGLAVSFIDSKLAGIMFVQVVHAAARPYAILQDMVIDRVYRGKHLGRQMLQWLEVDLKKRAIDLLFLESGIHNLRAHDFFESNGFSVSSKVMVKELLTAGE